MKNEIFPISFSVPAIPFIPSEISKVDPKLVGIVALIILRKINDQEYYEWVYLGYGTIIEELSRAGNNPSVLKYRPTHFNYIENPKNGEQYLKRLKAELKPHCS